MPKRVASRGDERAWSARSARHAVRGVRAFDNAPAGTNPCTGALRISDQGQPVEQDKHSPMAIFEARQRPFRSRLVLVPVLSCVGMLSLVFVDNLDVSVCHSVPQPAPNVLKHFSRAGWISPCRPRQRRGRQSTHLPLFRRSRVRERRTGLQRSQSPIKTFAIYNAFLWPQASPVAPRSRTPQVP